MPDTKGRYSIEELQNGFKRFLEEYGRYPGWAEIDTCSYLPSVRQIQRRFGGLPVLRAKLGLPDVDFSKGELRKAISDVVGKRGFLAERDLERALIEHFGEEFVHIEKPVNATGKVRCDFFVYAKDCKFGVDIFCSESRHNIHANLDIKLRKYDKLDFPMYLVLVSEKVTQDVLDDMSIKKSKLRVGSRIHLLTAHKFLESIKAILPLRAS